MMSRRVDDELRCRPLTDVLVTQPKHKCPPERCRMKHSLANSSKEGKEMEAAGDFPLLSVSLAIQFSQWIVIKFSLILKTHTSRPLAHPFLIGFR